MTIIRTLLADDHALIRAGLRDALNSIPDIEITGEAANGRELLHALDALRPDLLVVDLTMPEFDPLSDIPLIRTRYPLTRILVVSAYDDQSYVVGVLAAGVNGYHLKDQPLADLQLAVRRILDGGRWISDPLVDRLIDQHQAQAPVQPEGAEKQPPLTRRQRELLYLLTQGYNNQKIAQLMDLSVKTVENHLTALYRTLNVESRLEASNYASRHPELLTVPSPERNARRSEFGPAESIDVLLVDDNPRYRQQLGKLVMKAWPEAELHEAEDSEEALRLAAQVRPRLAFIDVVLRHEDGIQCVRRMKVVSPTTRMVMISAYPDREFRRISLNAGAIAFLDKKDIDAAAVRQVVEDTLSAI